MKTRQIKKHNVLAIAVFAFLLCTENLHAAESPDIRRAIDYGAKGKITLRVVDSKGNPVSGAKVITGFDNPRNEDDGMDGLTDAGGFFAATGTTGGDMHYQITKDGYYETESSYWFYRQNEPQIVKDGRWQPWNPTNTVVLKEVRHPAPMFARVAEIKVPVRDVPVGFDLEKADWVAPYGKGIKPDILIRYSNTNTGPGFLDFSRQLEMTFDNTNDGIMVFPMDRSSVLCSLYEAPEIGYSPSLLLLCDRTTDKVRKQVDLDENHYAIFRVRSVTDNHGSITSAKFGKIYGPIQYGVLSGHQSIILVYYFNPDGTRNLEFSPQSNLFTNLPRLEEKVYKP